MICFVRCIVDLVVVAGEFLIPFLYNDRSFLIKLEFLRRESHQTIVGPQDYWQVKTFPIFSFTKKMEFMSIGNMMQNKTIDIELTFDLFMICYMFVNMSSRINRILCLRSEKS